MMRRTALYCSEQDCTHFISLNHLGHYSLWKEKKKKKACKFSVFCKRIKCQNSVLFRYYFYVLVCRYVFTHLGTSSTLSLMVIRQVKIFFLLCLKRGPQFVCLVLQNTSSMLMYLTLKPLFQCSYLYKPLYNYSLYILDGMLCSFCFCDKLLSLFPIQRAALCSVVFDTQNVKDSNITSLMLLFY